MRSFRTEGIQRGVTFLSVGNRQVVSMAIDQLQPVIRVAHQVGGPGDIGPRLIFDHEFVLILSGSGRLENERETLTYATGDLIFLRPFEPHAFFSLAPGHHIAVHFDFLAAGIPIDQGGDREPYRTEISGYYLPTVLKAPLGIFESLTAVVENWQASSPLEDLAARAHLMQAMAILGCQETFPQLVPTWYTFVLKHIEGCLDEPLPVDRLAKLAHLSPSRFRTLFKLQTGRSPAEFIVRQRMTRARILLANPTLSVKEIAAMCGYPDPLHFSRAFRQADGLSPSQYRDAVFAGRPI